MTLLVKIYIKTRACKKTKFGDLQYRIMVHFYVCWILLRGSVSHVTIVIPCKSIYISYSNVLYIAVESRGEGTELRS